MENFNLCIPTEIYFGKGQIKELSRIIKSCNRKKILLVYGGGSIKRNGVYIDVMRELDGYEIFELSSIEPNPKISSVRRGVHICRENKIDLVLAVGGGSVIDCAKVIAAGYFYDGDPWDIIWDSSKIKGALPIVTVLTLAGSGSEMNENAVITNPDTNEKLAMSSKYIIPIASIMDPTYLYSLPPIQTAAGTADIISHVLEVYFNNPESSFLSDRISESIVKTCIEYCPVALESPNNYEARANLMWASSMALNGICGAGKFGVWSCHPIEHELSAYYNIIHGVGLAIITPAWMRYALSDSNIDKFVDFSANVFGIKKNKNKLDIAMEGIYRLKQFFADCGIPSSLTELGIDNSKFDVMAKRAVKFGMLEYGYVPLNEGDVKNILEECV